MSARVHSEDPFATPPEKREPARRLRGRLAEGVTIWTAGPPDARAGLTVSSTVVAEGEPSLVLGLINDTTDVFEALESTSAFVMHVLPREMGTLADRFAGHRPSPGGLFSDLDVVDTEWGPVISTIGTRAFCHVESTDPVGFHRLVKGRIEKLELDELADPLVYFRGKYRKLS